MVEYWAIPYPPALNIWGIGLSGHANNIRFENILKSFQRVSYQLTHLVNKITAPNAQKCKHKITINETVSQITCKEVDSVNLLR